MIGSLRLFPLKMTSPLPVNGPSLEPSVKIKRLSVEILLKLSNLRETLRGVRSDGCKSCGPSLNLGARILRLSHWTLKSAQASLRSFAVGPECSKMWIDLFGGALLARFTSLRMACCLRKRSGGGIFAAASR